LAVGFCPKNVAFAQKITALPESSQGGCSGKTKSSSTSTVRLIDNCINHLLTYLWCGVIGGRVQQMMWYWEIYYGKANSWSMSTVRLIDNCHMLLTLSTSVPTSSDCTLLTGKSHT